MRSTAYRFPIRIGITEGFAKKSKHILSAEPDSAVFGPAPLLAQGLNGDSIDCLRPKHLFRRFFSHVIL